MDGAGRGVRRPRRRASASTSSITPIFEHLEVFQRVGESTDVVRKEMYDFEDKGGRRLALRPEGTAPVVRAFVQHRPPPPWKVWYVAPHFRYERPQKGRYRQHWQVGAEVLGVDDPQVDVEVIALARRLLPRPRARATFTLLLNSMGDAAEPARVRRRAARRTCSTHGDALGDDVPRAGRGEPAAGARLEGRADWQDVIEHAPQITEHLGDDAARRTSRRCRTGSTALGIALRARPAARARPRLLHEHHVRVPAADALDAAQNAHRRRRSLRRAGRGDGRPAHAGHRVRHRHRARADRAATPKASCPAATPRVDVFVVDGLGDAGSRGRRCSSPSSARTGCGAERAYGGRSVEGADGRSADRSGARFARDARARRSRARRGRGEGPAHRASRSRCRAQLVAGWLQERRETEDTSDDAHRSRRRSPRRPTSAATSCVCGWVDSRRDHGGVVFLDVRDAAGIVQVVVDPEQRRRRRRAPRAQRVRACASRARCAHRPEGTVNDDAAHRRGRGRARPRSRC